MYIKTQIREGGSRSKPCEFNTWGSVSTFIFWEDRQHLKEDTQISAFEIEPYHQSCFLAMTDNLHCPSGGTPTPAQIHVTQVWTLTQGEVLHFGDASILVLQFQLRPCHNFEIAGIGIELNVQCIHGLPTHTTKVQLIPTEHGQSQQTNSKLCIIINSRVRFSLFPNFTFLRRQNVVNSWGLGKIK